MAEPDILWGEGLDDKKQRLDRNGGNKTSGTNLQMEDGTRSRSTQNAGKIQRSTIRDANNSGNIEVRGMDQ